MYAKSLRLALCIAFCIFTAVISHSQEEKCKPTQTTTLQKLDLKITQLKGKITALEKDIKTKKDEIDESNEWLQKHPPTNNDHIKVVKIPFRKSYFDKKSHHGYFSSSYEDTYASISEIREIQKNFIRVTSPQVKDMEDELQTTRKDLETAKAHKFLLKRGIELKNHFEKIKQATIDTARSVVGI